MNSLPERTLEVFHHMMLVHPLMIAGVSMFLGGLLVYLVLRESRQHRSYREDLESNLFKLETLLQDTAKQADPRPQIDTLFYVSSLNQRCQTQLIVKYFQACAFLCCTAVGIAAYYAYPGYLLSELLLVSVVGISAMGMLYLYQFRIKRLHEEITRYHNILTARYLHNPFSWETQTPLEVPPVRDIGNN